MPGTAVGAATFNAVSLAVFTATSSSFLAIAAANIVIYGAGAVLSLGASLALSAASSALTGGAKKSSSPALSATARDRTVTIRQPIAPRRVIYGEVRVSGVMTFIESTDSNRKLHQLVTIAGHEVQEIGEIIVNDEFVTFNASNEVISGPYARHPTKEFITIEKGLGATAGDSALNTALIANSSSWTSNHKQSGCAKIYTEFQFESGVFISNLPNISAIVKGRKVYDPRTSTTVYSNNAALCIRDYLFDTEYGLGEPSARINDTSFTAAANICEEMVSVEVSRTFTADAVLDRLTLSSTAGGVRTGDEMEASNSGGVLPAPLVAGTKYYWIVVDGSTGKLATSKDNALAGAAIDITGAGTGAHTITRVLDKTFTADASTDVVTLSAKIRGLVTGNGIEITTAGTLPGGLALSTTYYYIRFTDTTGKLATSYSNSLTGTAINITDAGTGTHTLQRKSEARYTCNGTFDTDQQPKDIIEALLTACGGKVTYQGGEWNLYVAAYTAPTITLTQDDLDGPISLDNQVGRRDGFNRVKGVFVSPDDLYQPTDFPVVTNATYLTEDNEEKKWKDVEFKFTTSASTAQRLAKIELEKVRRQKTLKLQCNLTALRLQAGDTMAFTYDRFGFAAKVFDIEEWAFAVRGGGNAPTLGIDLTLRETDANVYAWNSGEEFIPESAPAPTLPSAFTASDPTGLIITETIYSSNVAGGVKARATLDWSAPDDAFVAEYQAEFKLTSDSTYLIVGKTENTTFEINDLATGTYNFRVFSINTWGVKSSPGLSSIEEILGLDAPPSALENLTIFASGGLAYLRWTQSTDLDVTQGGKIVFRHSKKTSGAIWAESVSIGDAIPGNASLTVLPLKKGTYLARAVDSSKIPSTSATVSTKQATVLSFINASTVSEHTTFLGTHSGTFVDGGILKLEGSSNIDDWGNIDDVADWDSEGGLNALGTYTHSASFDFSSVVNKRLTTTLDVLVVNVLDDIDDRTANIDDWVDFDGTDSGDADAKVFTRHTDDDPADSPTWSAWERLDSAEFKARAFQFKTELSTNDPAYNIEVEELTITAENVAP